MSNVLATLVVVPRERFGGSLETIDNIHRNTDEPFELVYVDAGFPPVLRSEIEKKAREYKFTLVQTDEYLCPNASRNLGLKHVETKYVVFLDNDVLVNPGWLRKLIDCAEETGAWIVGPFVMLRKKSGRDVVHFANGVFNIEERNGKRYLNDKHHYFNRDPAEILPLLKREPCDQVEFHCMLVRKSFFDQHGPLDHNLAATRDHFDVCYLARKHGGTVYFEPASSIVYVEPFHLERYDWPFFLLRWSEAWTKSSLIHFQAKWNLDPTLRHMKWLRWHRRLPLRCMTAFLPLPVRVLLSVLNPLERMLNILFFSGPNPTGETARLVGVVDSEVGP